MTNQEINEKIKQAFSNAVPDVLDAVLTECTNQEGKVIVMTEKRKIPSLKKWAIGIAAAFVLCIGGAAGFGAYQTNYAVDSTVSLDVNPSIEITVNQKERVLAVDAKNEDGKKVIGDMDFKGSDLDVTLNALIGSMLKNGYLSDIANSILVSVDNSDPDKSARLQERLAEEINKMLQTDTFSGAVLSQTISSDSDLQKLADKYGITLGKAQLIQQIISKDTRHTFEELVSLTINELNLLSKSGSITLDNVDSVGTASDKAYIGEKKAKAAALSHAGLSAEEITRYTCKLDSEDGIIVYEIEFSGGGYEYEYDIHAVSGVVLKYEKEPDEDYVAPKEPDKDTAQTPDAGTTPDTSQTPDTGTTPDTSQTPGTGTTPDTSQTPDTGTTPDTSQTPGTGTTPDTSQTPDTGTTPDTSQTPNTGTTPGSGQVPNGGHHHGQGDGGYHHAEGCIGEARAKEAACAHAGVAVGDITKYKCELDTEDGVCVYEIEFDCGGYEYEYEVDAASGAIINYEKENDD